MIKFIEHRIADQRVVRHIKKWLNVGMLEDGELTRAEEGTPQGGSVSPLFPTTSSSDSRARKDALQSHQDFRERLKCFNLELHAEKTPLIEFGRYAAENRKAREEGKPETFDFLIFTRMAIVYYGADKLLLSDCSLTKSRNCRRRRLTREALQPEALDNMPKGLRQRGQSGGCSRGLLRAA